MSLKNKNPLTLLNVSAFLQTQFFLLPVLFLFYRYCGLSLGDFFLFQGCFSLAVFIFEIPMGYLGDVISKKNVLILSYSFFIARLVLWLFFSRYGYWIILVGELLFAAQKASFSGAADSYIYEYLKQHNKPQKMLEKYGKMNFFLAAGTAFSSWPATVLYHKVSEWTEFKYGYNYGFVFLMLLELVMNIIALYLLTFLPKIREGCFSQKTVSELYKNFFSVLKNTVRNKKLIYHSLYSGLLISMTSVFVWSFQPMMKRFLFPVSMYGLVYFINHVFRAFSSLFLSKTREIISFSKMYLLTFFLFFCSFVLTFVLFNIQNDSIFLCLFYFTFVSFAIAMQLTYHLSTTSRLHVFSSPNIRATVSSVNMAVGRLFSVFFLVLIKLLLNVYSFQKVFAICFALFVVMSICLRKVYFISREEEK